MASPIDAEWLVRMTQPKFDADVEEPLRAVGHAELVRLTQPKFDTREFQELLLRSLERLQPRNLRGGRILTTRP